MKHAVFRETRRSNGKSSALWLDNIVVIVCGTYLVELVNNCLKQFVSESFKVVKYTGVDSTQHIRYRYHRNLTAGDNACNLPTVVKVTHYSFGSDVTSFPGPLFEWAWE